MGAYCALRAACTKFVQEHTEAGQHWLLSLIMTLVLQLFELHACSPLICCTLCVVVHAIEKRYPVLVNMIIRHSMSTLKLMRTLSLL